MSSNKPLLISIVGPTAIGKTSLAIEVAKSFSAEIISSDSRQFYKEMTIGTAVPCENELSSIKHHFIQSKSIFETYSVGDFERECLSLLERLFSINSVTLFWLNWSYQLLAIVRGIAESKNFNRGYNDKQNIYY